MRNFHEFWLISKKMQQPIVELDELSVFFFPYCPQCIAVKYTPRHTA
jgi:hypothetical protein